MTLQYTKIQQEKLLKENPLPPMRKIQLDTMQCIMGNVAISAGGWGRQGGTAERLRGENKQCP